MAEKLCTLRTKGSDSTLVEPVSVIDREGPASSSSKSHSRTITLTKDSSQLIVTMANSTSSGRAPAFTALSVSQNGVALTPTVSGVSGWDGYDAHKTNIYVGDFKQGDTIVATGTIASASAYYTTIIVY